MGTFIIVRVKLLRTWEAAEDKIVLFINGNNY